MKKIHLVPLLFLPLFTIAQSNYKSGFAVTLKGDTLRGYIDYKEWDHNPKNINFKTNQVDKSRQLGLTEINYFEINNYVSYREYSVSISLNPIDISSPSSAADTTSETDNVFLKILQTGKNVTLYSYRDGIKERFYIKGNGTDIPAELLYGVYQDINSSDKVINKNTYRIQLEQLVVKYNSGDDKLTAQVQGSDYKEEALAAIAAEINGNSQAQASMGRADRAAIRFFAGAGIISNTVKAGQYYGTPGSTSTTPKIAAGADLIINPAVGHLVFRIELAYSTNNYTFNDISDPIFNIADPQLNSIMVKQDIISLTPQVIYNIYNRERLKVFVDLGFCLNILSYPPNKLTQSGGTLTSGSNIIFDSKSNYSAIQIKAGLVIAKRIEIYGAFFPKADLSGALNFTNDISSYQLGINYYFGKGAQ